MAGRMTRAGKLRDFITIERRSAVADGAWGEDGETWATFGEVWAEVKPIRSGEKYRAVGGVESSATHQIRTRYIAGITSADRIIFRGRTFDIVGLAEVESAGREWLIDAVQHPQGA